MYETKSGKKFGSSYVGKKFDSYHAGEQPGESNENEHSTPEEHGEDKVNTMGKDETPHDKTATSAHAETPSAIVASHGPAHTVHIAHNEDGTHRVSSAHDDGYNSESDHSTSDEAHSHAEQLSLEAGGEDQASDVKRRAHYPQQGAESESRNFEAPDLV